MLSKYVRGRAVVAILVSLVAEKLLNDLLVQEE